ncbi:MAG: AAA family ATPase [bacterium]
MYNENLQQKLTEYLEVKKISQAKVAPLIGLSQTALSQWRNCKYDKGNIEEIESKIQEFFKLEEEQATIIEKKLPFINIQDYIPTSISEEIYQLIQYCHVEKGMAVAHGDAGIGKTKGACQYAKDNPSSTIYIQATPSTGTLSNILKLLARALRISESKNKLDLMQDIRSKLEVSNKVIIIDEAQHLKYAALEEIRTLSDPNIITGDTGTGIVLIGNTEVFDRMLGKQEARFAQQFSRIRMNRHYATSQVIIEDIKLLFPILTERSMKKEIEFLHGISQSKWGVRGAVNVYNNAVNNENINYDGLFSMARGMGIGILA